MKQIKSLLLITSIVCLIIFSACNQNKMGQNEEVVKDKLLAQEAVIAEQKRLAEERAKAFADSIAKLPKALRVQADRSIDAMHPPIVLDIEEARTRVKPITYSQLGNKIRYVKLSHPLDKEFVRGAKVLLTDYGIVLSGFGGVACFDNNGAFKEIICKNEQTSGSTGFVYVGKGSKSKDYRGVRGMPFVIGNNIYYRYVDEPNNQTWIMEYDMLQPKLIQMQQDIEQQAKPKGKRKVQEHTRVDWREKDMIALDKYHWVSNKIKWNSSQTGYFLSAHNFSGDTVCQLKDFDPIKNYTASTYRGVEGNDIYRLNGHLHFRQSFNDTIYQFESLNCVKPLYVIDFGKKKIASSMEGINPKYDLTDKYVVNNILETNKFVFIFYTKNYVCPNTAIKGTLQYNCFIYDKTTNKTFHTYINEPAVLYVPKNSKLPPSPNPPQKGIINDLDYGIATSDFKQTEDGKLYKLVRGKEIKEHIQSHLKNTNTTHKALLEKIAETSADDDLFLMIIE